MQILSTFDDQLGQDEKSLAVQSLYATLRDPDDFWDQISHTLPSTILENLCSRSVSKAQLGEMEFRNPSASVEPHAVRGFAFSSAGNQHHRDIAMDSMTGRLLYRPVLLLACHVC